MPKDGRPSTYRKNYGPEHMRRAYDMWKEEGVAVYRAAQLCGVPVETLRNRTKGLCEPYITKSGRRPLMTSSEEEAFVAHVTQVAACGYGYMRRELAGLAGDTAFFLNTRETSAPVNDKWVFKFLNRWPNMKMVTARGSPVVRASCATRKTLNNYYKELLGIVQKYDLLEKPHRIFAVDETHISSKHIPPKMAAPRGQPKLMTGHQKTDTVINCVSAAGQVLPPYVIFKGKRQFTDKLIGAFPGTQCTVSESGSSNSKIFQTYLSEHFLTYSPSNKDNKPLLVLYDGHSCHVTAPLIEWAQQHNIFLFLLPSYASYMLQPLDVAIFDPFKVAYYNECQDLLKQTPGQMVNRSNICRLVCKALMQAMTPDMITACFRDMGIYPFNANVVSDELLAPSMDVDIKTEKTCEL